MAWVRYSRATVDSGNPRALGTCDRCGFIWNRDRLSWQYDWRGPKLQNLRILVCPECYDAPQEQLRSIIIPPDPIPILDPRPDPYMWTAQSSSPPDFASGSPSVITTESSLVIVTEVSSLPLITEINVVPTPTSSGFTST